MKQRQLRIGDFHFIIYAALLITFIHSALAFGEHMRFSQIYFQHGLRSDWVFDIAIDSLGFTWFAGHTGLTRYDGRSTRHYHANAAITNSLTENQVFRLLVANRNEILCSTIGGGLNLLNIETGNFKKIHLGHNPDLNYVSAGLKLKDNRYIYLAGRPKHIIILTRNANDFSAKQIPLKWATGNVSFHENKARDIFIDPNDSNKIWIIGNFRIYKFNLEEEKLYLEKEFDFLLNRNINFESIVAVSWLDSDHLILNFTGKGFHRFNIRNQKLEFLFPDPAAPESTDVIEKSASGFFWLGSRNGKFFSYDPNANLIENISLFPHDLKPFSIETILEAPDGTILMGTKGQGVLKYNPYKNAFRTIELRNLVSAEDDFIRSGELHIQQPYYYFTLHRKNGVFRFHLHDKTISKLNDSKISNINRGNIVRWNDGNLLTHNRQELYVIDTHKNSLVRYPLPMLDSITRYEDREIRSINVLHEKTLLINGDDFLMLVHNEENWITDLRMHPDVGFIKGLSSIWEKDRILLHDENFLYDWRPEYQSIEKLRFSDPHFNDMFKSIRKIFPYGGKYYLFSALQGVFIVTTQNESIYIEEHLTAPENLLSNNVYNASMDNDSVFWLATGLGIVRFDPSIETVINYSYEQNLPILYQDRAPRINDAGYFAINTSEQFIWARKEDLSPTGINSNIVVNSLFINDDERVSGLLNDPLASLTLKHDENNIRIAWSHITPLPHAYYSMEYILENFDETWKTTTDGFFATYTNIPPGKYNFRIRAANLHDKNEVTTLILPISVSPAFWATLWFRILIILILALVFYMIFKLKVNNVKKEERLKTEYNKRLAELELTNLRSQMNPHFMFNSLNSIKHFILKNEKEKAAEYLSNFAQLIRDILNYSNVELISLADEIKTLNRYIELEQMRFNRGFEFEFILDPLLDIHQVQLQPLILQPFVENAIWHGLMHKSNDRKMEVRISLENDRLYCQVKDNGIGRRQAEIIQERSGIKKSHGISITQLRMQQNDEDALVEIIDLADSSGKPAGTLVNINLPYKVSESSFA
ncbi:MAG: hypothetical protein EA393_08440 [Bacteroidetes bacterium]|nr:MAG: hypothetical protein EA393_08440 [Bacteroidota bacterium]